jgi:ribosomal protein S27AE
MRQPITPHRGPRYAWPWSAVCCCPRCGSSRVRPVRYRWYGGLLTLCLMRRLLCGSCGITFVGFLWQRADEL